MLGTQEAIRQSQAKEKREEHRARRCNLIVGCVRTSVRSKEINGKKIVLRDHKLYIDTENAAETDESSGHPFAGYYLPYPDSEYEGLVSTITHVAPILNWIYIDKETLEVKYGVRDLAQPHLTGPFDCTRQDRRLTFEDWEGFVAVEEHPMTWALYFDRDDTGLKGRVKPGQKVLEVVLTRQERKKMKEEAQKAKVTDKEKAEQAGDHQASYVQGAAAAEQDAAQDTRSGAASETPPSRVLSAADLAKLKIATAGPSSIWSDHIEGTVSSPTEPWGAASMWSNQEQQATSGAASHLAPFTPSSSIYGDDEGDAGVAPNVPEETTPRRNGYRQPYVEDEVSTTKDLITEGPQERNLHTLEEQTAPLEPVVPEHAHKHDDQQALDAEAGAEPQPGFQTTNFNSVDTEAHIDQQAIGGVTSGGGEQLDTRNVEGLSGVPQDIFKDTVGLVLSGGEYLPRETSAEWQDAETVPRVAFETSHTDSDAVLKAEVPLEGSTSSSEVVADRTDAAVIVQDQALEDGAFAAAGLQQGIAQDDYQPSVAVNTALTLDDEENREPVSTPVQPMQQVTPGLHPAEPPSAVDSLPPWAALPEPYWNTAPESPPRSLFRVEGSDTPRQRNFSRPQQSIEPESPSRKRKPNDPAGSDRMADESSAREDSAPPITVSKEPYPVEDDPTSTDTSLVDVSYTARSPYENDNHAAAAAVGKKLVDPSELPATEPLAQTSTHSSATLGELGLQEHINRKTKA